MIWTVSFGGESMLGDAGRGSAGDGALGDGAPSSALRFARRAATLGLRFACVGGAFALASAR